MYFFGSNEFENLKKFTKSTLNSVLNSNGSYIIPVQTINSFDEFPTFSSAPWQAL